MRIPLVCDTLTRSRRLAVLAARRRIARSAQRVVGSALGWRQQSGARTPSLAELVERCNREGWLLAPMDPPHYELAPAALGLQRGELALLRHAAARLRSIADHDIGDGPCDRETADALEVLARSLA